LEDELLRLPDDFGDFEPELFHPVFFARADASLFAAADRAAS
jgi:hypothetical protein